jgi:hypothetical protein
MWMMRERVLALLLVISVLANGYLIFTYHPALDPYSPASNSSPFAFLFVQNNSYSENVPIFDEYGQPVSLPSLEVPLDTGDRNQSPDKGEGEMNGSVIIPEGAVTETPTVEVTTPVTIDPYATYTSAKYGFSLRYPRSWFINEAVAGRTVLTLGAPVETMCDSDTNQCYKYVANFTVEVDPNPSTLVIEDYFTNAVARLQRDYSITTTTRSATAMLSNARAYQIEYFTHDKRGNPVRSFMQYYTIIDGKGYIISYFGPYYIRENVFDHNKADAQQIINSIEIIRTFKPV